MLTMLQERQMELVSSEAQNYECQIEMEARRTLEGFLFISVVDYPGKKRLETTKKQK